MWVGVQLICNQERLQKEVNRLNLLLKKEIGKLTLEDCYQLQILGYIVIKNNNAIVVRKSK